MRTIKFLLLYILLSLCGGIEANAQLKHLDKAADFGEHPRLLLFDSDIQQIKGNIEKNQLWKKIDDVIQSESRKLFEVDVVKRIKTGRRLLAVSREALRRIFYLSYSYRITSDEQFKARAEKEMLAIADFEDWNPSHFLDVAEMTLAMAIGYDWLYHDLSESSRTKIKDAIIKKGIDTSFSTENNSWLSSGHNWNQVCNAGMAYGAIAVYEDMPEIAKVVVDRAVSSIALPMKGYAPDGAYPEGFTYWSYGTSFNVLFLSAVEKLFHTDFGLSSMEGFLPSAYFIENMITPSKESFNYGDSGDATSLNPTLFWFADKMHDSTVLWSQYHYLTKKKGSSFAKNRILPALMIWGKNIDLAHILPPSRNLWVGQGVTPVGSMRTSWTDPDAIFVGLKTGRAGANHSHMDIGSFIMEADGVRWAIDLGPQDYTSLETVGIDLWNRKQNSQRWDVYRYNNFSHNTLAFDHKKQNVNGYTRIDSYGDSAGFMHLVSDLSNAYKSQVKSCNRGIAVVDNRFVVVQDEIETQDKPTELTWTMVTRAAVRKLNDCTLELTDKGKKMIFKVESNQKIKLRSVPAKSSNSYDESNDGVTLIGFETSIPALAQARYCVKLIPRNTKAKYKITPLKEWK